MNLKLQAFSSPPGLLKRGEGRRLRVCVCGGGGNTFLKRGANIRGKKKEGGVRQGRGRTGWGAHGIIFSSAPPARPASKLRRLSDRINQNNN